MSSVQFILYKICLDESSLLFFYTVSSVGIIVIIVLCAICIIISVVGLFCCKKKQGTEIMGLFDDIYVKYFILKYM